MLSPLATVFTPGAVSHAVSDSNAEVLIPAASLHSGRLLSPQVADSQESDVESDSIQASISHGGPGPAVTS